MASQPSSASCPPPLVGRAGCFPSITRERSLSKIQKMKEENEALKAKLMECQGGRLGHDLFERDNMRRLKALNLLRFEDARAIHTENSRGDKWIVRVSPVDQTEMPLEFCTFFRSFELINDWLNLWGRGVGASSIDFEVFYVENDKGEGTAFVSDPATGSVDVKALSACSKTSLFSNKYDVNPLRPNPRLLKHPFTTQFSLEKLTRSRLDELEECRKNKDTVLKAISQDLHYLVHRTSSDRGSVSVGLDRIRVSFSGERTKEYTYFLRLNVGWYGSADLPFLSEAHAMEKKRAEDDERKARARDNWDIFEIVFKQIAKACETRAARFSTGWFSQPFQVPFRWYIVGPQRAGKSSLLWATYMAKDGWVEPPVDVRTAIVDIGGTAIEQAPRPLEPRHASAPGISCVAIDLPGERKSEFFKGKEHEFVVAVVSAADVFEMEVVNDVEVYHLQSTWQANCNLAHANHIDIIFVSKWDLLFVKGRPDSMDVLQTRLKDTWTDSTKMNTMGELCQELTDDARVRLERPNIIVARFRSPIRGEPMSPERSSELQAQGIEILKHFLDVCSYTLSRVA